MLFRVIDVSNMGNLIRQGNFFTFFLEVGKTSSFFKYRFSAFWLRSKFSNCSYQLNI